MDKSDLRDELKQSLQFLSNEQLQELSKLLSKNLLNLLPKIKSEHCLDVLKLGVYIPIQKEPIWFSAFKGDEGRFLMVSIKENLNLSYHPIDFETILNTAPCLELSKELRIQAGTANVLLIPGLGFTKTGERLGRGKGFFDRYLENFQGIKMGVCFERQLSETVFSEPHDKCMDYIITETNIYKKNK